MLFQYIDELQKELTTSAHHERKKIGYEVGKKDGEKKQNFVIRLYMKRKKMADTLFNFFARKRKVTEIKFLFDRK